MQIKPRLSASHIILVILICVFASQAQTPSPTPAVDETDVQQWNDVTIVKPISDKVDLLVPFTARFTKNISRLNEGRIGIGAAYKPTSSVTLNSTYLFIRARSSSGDFATEHRITGSVSYKFPVKVVGLSHRSTVEVRLRSSGNSWRYRPAVTLEKKLPERWVKGARVYVTEDPFYDSAAGRFSRNRLSFGFGKELSKHLTLDVYYLRQDDRNSAVRLTHVIGTSWKVNLD